MTTSISKLATLILRSIGGGVISDDLQPKRPTVEYYVSLALKYVFIEEYRRNRRDEITNPYSHDISAFPDREYFTTYKLPVIREDDEVYVDLPVGPLSIPGNRWLDRAFVKRSESFVLVRVPDEVRSLDPKELGGNTIAYPENRKVFFLGLSPLTGEVSVAMAPDPLGLGAEAALNLPSGVEYKVIELGKQFFLGTKQVPKDLINDNTDS